MPTKEELKQILLNWPAADGLRAQPHPIVMGEYLSDSTFMVGEHLVLKLYTDEHVLRRVLRLTEALESQAFCAATPLVTSQGSLYVAGVPCAMLVRRVPGHPLSMEARFGDDWEELALETGGALARLHRTLRAVQDDIPTEQADLYETCAHWALPIVKKQNAQWQLGLGDGYFDSYLDEFESLCRALPRQLIHRDPNPSNILFEGDKVSGFIDFDLHERNVRLLDVCYSATGILSECGGSPERFEQWFEILGAILRGYHAAEPLTQEERRAVYPVICSIQMIFCAYCAGYEDPMMRTIWANNRRMISFLSQNRARIEAACGL